jgi:glycosyltransferase involved in cell wall biosynthesis
MQRVLYRRLTRLVVQSERTRPAAARLVGARRVAVIPNFVSPSILRGRDGVGSGENIDAPQGAVRIVTTSRLEPPKGHAVLLRALAVTRASAPWRLRVLGEGSQRDSLERLTVELGLADKVSFAGWTPDPVSTLRGSDIFVLASRFEGHPLSLIEAMSCGLAVIATDCPTGPAEFIRPDDNGLLIPVDDVPAMASALARLVDDPELRARLGASAATIAKDASIDKTAELWDALLADISGSPG